MPRPISVLRELPVGRFLRSSFQFCSEIKSDSYSGIDTEKEDFLSLTEETEFSIFDGMTIILTAIIHPAPFLLQQKE